MSEIQKDATHDTEPIDVPFVGDDCTRYPAMPMRSERRYLAKGDNQIVIFAQQTRLEGEVIDQSKGGLGIRMSDVSLLHEGQRVRIVFRHNPATAVVTFISPDEEGFHVGLRFR